MRGASMTYGLTGMGVSGMSKVKFTVRRFRFSKPVDVDYQLGKATGVNRRCFACAIQPPAEEAVTALFSSVETAWNIASSDPTILVSEADESIQLDASATIDTSFMKVLGYNELTVMAEAEVVRQMVAIDVGFASANLRKCWVDHNIKVGDL